MRFFKNGFALAAICAASIMLSTNAHAQFSSTGGNGPTRISADDVVTAGQTTTLTGGVDVRQGDTRVLADKMIITSSEEGNLQNTDFSRVEAIGNFYYLTSDQEVRGKNGVYTKANDTFVVTGNVILKQADGNIVTGEKLFYNLTTQHARVVGTCKGRRCGSKGRVNILIKNTNNNNNRS